MYFFELVLTRCPPNVTSRLECGTYQNFKHSTHVPPNVTSKKELNIKVTSSDDKEGGRPSERDESDDRRQEV